VDTNETVKVELGGADLELLRAGEAKGRAAGIREMADGLTETFQGWRTQMVAAQPDAADQVDQFLAAVFENLTAWRQKANEADRERNAALGRAIALGAGRPRQRTLLDHLRGAIVGGVAGWRGR